MNEETSSHYIAEFLDGPLSGEPVTRSLIDDTFEQDLVMMAAVEGLESTFHYTAVDSRDVEGELHVQYRFDAGDSDSAKSDPDDNEWTDTV